MLLYDSPVSGNCYKVRLLFAHLGHRRTSGATVDVVDRSNRREFLGGLNPARRVPTLVLDDGRPLAESNAILWYFGEGTRFVPDDAYARAQVLQWHVLGAVRARAGDRGRAVPARRTRAGRSATRSVARELTKRRRARARRRWSDYLDGRDWFVGDGMTLADIALYAYTHAADEGGFSLERLAGDRARGSTRVAAEPGHVADRRVDLRLQDDLSRP